MRQGGHVHAGLHTVTLDVGIHEECRAVFSQTGNHIIHRIRRIPHPATGLQASVFRIQRNADATGAGMAQRRETGRIFQSQRTDDQTGHTRIKPAMGGFLVTDTAAKLYGDGKGFTNPADQIRIRRHTFKRAVQIHKMQELCALLLPLQRRRNRIVGKDRGVVGTPAPEAHSLPPFDIHCGKKDHKPNSLIIFCIPSIASSCAVSHLAPRLRNVSKFIRLSLRPTCFSLKWERDTNAPPGSRTSIR